MIPFPLNVQLTPIIHEGSLLHAFGYTGGGEIKSFLPFLSNSLIPHSKSQLDITWLALMLY